MCSSKSSRQLRHHQQVTTTSIPAIIAKINGRPVLQLKSSQVPTLERHNSLKKNTPKSPSLQPLPLPTPDSPCKINNPSSLSPPISPKLKSPRPPPLKRGNDPNGLNSSAEKVSKPRNTSKVPVNIVKSKKSCPGGAPAAETLIVNYNYSSLIAETPAGSIAAARREQVAIMQEQRKLRIAHYGRVKSINKKEEKDFHVDSAAGTIAREEKRCSFITPSSDPTYVAYHDEEWGVPVHDDMLLFELLVLTGAQIGSDWTSVLKKRQAFREAFSGFDAEVVAKFNEKRITSVSDKCGIDIRQVRVVVDNSHRILQVKREFGSLDNYLWGFVNHKPVCSQYKSCNKIPVKTSKSETISKDMVRKGFRYVGPTVIYSFMQAAGLSNDHLITCSRHLQIQLNQSPTSL